jgi:hypothetical protein
MEDLFGFSNDLMDCTITSQDYQDMKGRVVRDLVHIKDNGRVATSTFTAPIQSIINASEVLGSSKKKQEVDSDLLCLWVPRTDKSCNHLCLQFLSLIPYNPLKQSNKLNNFKKEI